MKRITEVEIAKLNIHLLTHFNASILENDKYLTSIIKHECEELYGSYMTTDDLDNVKKFLKIRMGWVENISY